jgi:uncharacterized protein YuzE
MEGFEMTANLAIDFGADAAYLTLSTDEIAETCEVAPGVLVDLNEMRIVVGVEVLSLGGVIPRDRLVTDFHLRAEDLELLDQIRPSVTHFVQSHMAPTAATAPSGVLAH